MRMYLAKLDREDFAALLWLGLIGALVVAALLPWGARYLLPLFVMNAAIFLVVAVREIRDFLEARAAMKRVRPCPFFGVGGRTEHCLHFKRRWFRLREDWCCAHRRFES